MAAVAIEFGRNAMTEQAEELTRGEALARVAVLEAELAKTQQREADTDIQLHALRKSIASTSTGVGDEKHQDALGEWETVLESINERYEFRAAPAPVERVEQETRSAWNLPCPFCGCDADPKGWLRGDGVRGPECDNCGATAASLEAWNKRTTPQPAPNDAQDVAGLVEALQLFVRWVDMEQSENVTAGVFDRLKAFRNAESKSRAALAAHQSGGAK